MTTTAGRVSLAAVLVCTTLTFGAGVAWKSYCVGNDWADSRQYTWACYTDIIPLLGTEQLGSGRLPFIDRCAPDPIGHTECDEYPVLTMYFMRAAASVSGADSTAFFWVNTALLWLCALVVAGCCYLLVGSRALFVALAPTLLLSGVLNWDLFAIALSCVALAYFFTRHDVAAGGFMGLGAAAKFFPALLVIPLLVDRVRSRDPDGAITFGWSAVGAWVVVNAPFAVIALGSWWEFFRFNSARPADFDSLWYVGYRLAGGDSGLHTKLIDIGSAVAFVVTVAIVWAVKAHRHPSFPRWTLGFPVVVLFLLTNKVYSPQYSLFLLPWFALALPSIWAFVLFELGDVLVYVTRFRWFATFNGLPGPSEGTYQVMIALRTAALLFCLVVWIVREAEPLRAERPPPPLPEPVAA